MKVRVSEVSGQERERPRGKTDWVNELGEGKFISSLLCTCDSFDVLAHLHHVFFGLDHIWTSHQEEWRCCLQLFEEFRLLQSVLLS